MQRLVLACATFSACGAGLLGAVVPASQQAEAAATSILDAARKLATAPVLTKDVVQETLDVVLAVDASTSHATVTFFSGAPRRGSRYERTVRLVDLRVPTPQNSLMKGPFLFVEMRPDAGISAEMLEARLGRPDEVDVPEPNPRYVMTYSYALRPSSLRYSIGPGTARPVVAFSIDRSGESR
jgi:hypothetical protein